ncbi:hypothetical protein EAG11_16410 [Flavobacterium sp. 140616W15]|nr:hypothetical protein EAG11_16410 [Flavobacterium sp. 140616W15]
MLFHEFILNDLLFDTQINSLVLLSKTSDLFWGYKITSYNSEKRYYYLNFIFGILEIHKNPQSHTKIHVEKNRLNPQNLRETKYKYLKTYSYIAMLEL